MTVFGFNPIDLAAILLLFTFAHGIFNSLTIDVVVLIPSFLIAKRTGRRADGYLTSLTMFLITPPILAVNCLDDIPVYRKVVSDGKMENK